MLIYTHGCVEDFDSIAVSLDDIGKRCINQLPSLKYYLENYYILFTGYRGADLDIFSYIATSHCKGIIWNGYTENGIIPKIRRLLRTQNAKIIIGDTTELLRQVSKRLNLPDLNSSIVEKYPRKNFVNEFQLWANEIDPVSKIRILGDLWEYIGEFDLAFKFYNSGYNLAQRYSDKYSETLLLGCIASVFYKMGNHKLAESMCQKALDNAEKFPELLKLNQHTHTFQLLGLIKSHSDLKDAAQLYLKALVSQEKLEKIYPPSKYKKAEILSNLANIFYKANMFEDSKRCNIGALNIYDAFGDISGRARVFICLGNIFLEQEQHDDCMQFYKNAEYLLSEIGDIFSLPKVLRDIAISYFNKGCYEKSKEYAQNALIYYEIISDEKRIKVVKDLLQEIQQLHQT